MINFEEIFNKNFKMGGYTIENTFLYSILYILAFLLLYFFVKKRKIILDKYFNINLILSFSFIVLIRVAMDFGWIKESFIFYTPFMQILVLALFSINLLDNEKRKEYSYFYLILIIIAILLFLRQIPNFTIIFAILIIFSIFYIFYKEKKKYYIFLPILSQLLDGIYGNFGIYFLGYSPKHVVHTYILNYFGLELGIPIFLILKFSILILTLLIINKYIEDIELKEIVYLMLFYVGYNSGLRNALLVAFHEI